MNKTSACPCALCGVMHVHSLTCHYVTAESAQVHDSATDRRTIIRLLANCTVIKDPILMSQSTTCCGGNFYLTDVLTVTVHISDG